MRDFLSIFKDGPVAGDVHVSSTGGPTKPKKPRLIAGTIDQNAKLPVTNPTAAAQAENPDEATSKRGARNSRVDHDRIQAIHDHACTLGASCADPDGDGDNDLNAGGDTDDDATMFEDALAQLGKRDGDAWSLPFKVTKADAEQQLIFGWASTSEIGGQLVVDKQDDAIDPLDLEKAAYNFVLYARKHGDMHDNVGTGRLVESMMFTREKQDILGIDLGKTAWWVGFKVDDPATWAAHKRGELPEFSIGGTGRRVKM